MEIMRGKTEICKISKQDPLKSKLPEYLSGRHAKYHTYADLEWLICEFYRKDKRLRRLSFGRVATVIDGGGVIYDPPREKWNYNYLNTCWPETRL